ncbi:MAG: NAD(P)-dependent oxidoreductase [Candidatus Omnitrophica bacterium]|nr:NAD(P)-dependent oxidoreductase [Candidatus Omnitrophota bacterium]
MRVLITGATGFIGGRVAERLVSRGHEVVCLVRKTSRISALERLGARFYIGEVTDPVSVLSAFNALRPDAAVHAAASVMSRDETKLFRVNAEGTRNVCDAALAARTGRLVHLSSIAVINGNDASLLEDDMPYKATGAYGRSKIAAEMAVLRAREKGLRTAIIRPCMIYGEDEPHAMDRIFYLASRGILPIPGTKEADSALHMGYVGNIAHIVELALLCEGALEGTFLAADREVSTVRRFLEIIYRELKGGRPPVMPAWAMNAMMSIPVAGGRIKRLFRPRRYDISRAEKILGYSPEVGFEEGMVRAVQRWVKKTGAGFVGKAGV